MELDFITRSQSASQSLCKRCTAPLHTMRQTSQSNPTQTWAIHMDIHQLASHSGSRSVGPPFIGAVIGVHGFAKRMTIRKGKHCEKHLKRSYCNKNMMALLIRPFLLLYAIVSTAWPPSEHLASNTANLIMTATSVGWMDGWIVWTQKKVSSHQRTVQIKILPYESSTRAGNITKKKSFPRKNCNNT